MIFSVLIFWRNFIYFTDKKLSFLQKTFFSFFILCQSMQMPHSDVVINIMLFLAFWMYETFSPNSWVRAVECPAVHLWFDRSCTVHKIKGQNEATNACILYTYEQWTCMYVLGIKIEFDGTWNGALFNIPSSMIDISIYTNTTWFCVCGRLCFMYSNEMLCCLVATLFVFFGLVHEYKHRLLMLWSWW